MTASSKQGSEKKKWYILGGLFIAGVVLLVLFGALLPIFITNWLGGKDFQRIASQQASSFLKTEGDFESFDWSSFSVYSAGFATRSGAKGEWNWDIRDIRTEISPRLLLDRILRFSEISIGSIKMKPGTGLVSVPEALSTKPGSSSSGSDLFRDVQVGKVMIKSFALQPGPTTSGWGVGNVGIEVHPNPQNTTFSIQGGEILSPLPWLGALSLQQAKGSYLSPQIYLTRLELKSAQGGTLELSGEGRTDSIAGRRGRLTWNRWPLPEGKIGVGLFDVPAKMSGSFELSDWKSDGPVGTGQVKLIDARLEPGKGSETILGLLAVLTGEPRLRGCTLSTAQASWTLEPGIYNVRSITAEAPGLLRVNGQVKVTGQNLSGVINLALEKNLGSKVSGLTGGELFRQESDGYLSQPIQISGTLDRPENDLQSKLTGALARTAIRTGAQILEKAAGAQGGSGGDAAGQAVNVLKGLFGPAPK
jgi:hypothetical protein